MKRDLKLFYEDILESINFIYEYIGNKDYSSFKKDIKSIDSVVRRIEIIGEAIKNIPKSIRDKNLEISWDDFIASRNFLAHVYFGVNYLRLWKFVKNDLPDLKKIVKKMMEELSGRKN